MEETGRLWRASHTPLGLQCLSINSAERSGWQRRKHKSRHHGAAENSSRASVKTRTRRRTHWLSSRLSWRAVAVDAIWRWFERDVKGVFNEAGVSTRPTHAF